MSDEMMKATGKRPAVDASASPPMADAPSRRFGPATMAGAAIGSAALLAAALYAGSRRGRGRKRAADADAPETPVAPIVPPGFDPPETD